MTDPDLENALSDLSPDQRTALTAAFDRLQSPAQRGVVTAHLINRNIEAALMVLSAPAALYAAHDRALAAAFLAGAAAALNT